MLAATHGLRRAVASRFSDRPQLLQRLAWPNPLRPPYTYDEINLYRPGELGDVVMCLAVVRAIRERNPTARITFITKYHELLRGHPLIDRVLTPEEATTARLRRVVSLRYEVFVPLRLHFIDYFAACVGLGPIPKEIPLPDFSAELGPIEARLGTGSPLIAICRKSGPFTPNKDWPGEYWDELIRRLQGRGTIVELGAERGAAPAGISGYVDLRGQTTLRQFCAVIAKANLVITPGTSAVHIAAAYAVPTVSVLSGYESPENSTYPRHRALYNRVECSGCWLRTPCPHGLKCLHSITVDAVDAAAADALTDV